METVPSKTEANLAKLRFAFKKDIEEVGGIHEVTTNLLGGHLEAGETVLTFTEMLRHQAWEEREDYLFEIQRRLQEVSPAVF